MHNDDVYWDNCIIVMIHLAWIYVYCNCLIKADSYLSIKDDYLCLETIDLIKAHNVTIVR